MDESDEEKYIYRPPPSPPLDDTSNDAEEEESRLRARLLAKQAKVVAVATTTTSSTSVSDVKVTVDSLSDKHSKQYRSVTVSGGFSVVDKSVAAEIAVEKKEEAAAGVISNKHHRHHHKKKKKQKRNFDDKEQHQDSEGDEVKITLEKRKNTEKASTSRRVVELDHVTIQSVIDAKIAERLGGTNALSSTSSSDKYSTITTEKTTSSINFDDELESLGPNIQPPQASKKTFKNVPAFEKRKADSSPPPVRHYNKRRYAVATEHYGGGKPPGSASKPPFYGPPMSSIDGEFSSSRINKAQLDQDFTRGKSHKEMPLSANVRERFVGGEKRKHYKLTDEAGKYRRDGPPPPEGRRHRGEEVKRRRSPPVKVGGDLQRHRLPGERDNRWPTKGPASIRSPSAKSKERIERHYSRKDQLQKQRSAQDPTSTDLKPPTVPKTPTQDELEDKSVVEVVLKKDDELNARDGSPPSKRRKRRSRSSSSMNSLESGELEHEVKKSSPQQTGKQKYSKFESSTSSSSSSSDSSTGSSGESDLESGGSDADQKKSREEQKNNLEPNQQSANNGLSDDELRSAEQVKDAPKSDVIDQQDEMWRDENAEPDDPVSKLPVYFPATMGCRSVEEFQNMNKIEEGTYGVVYRAIEKRTGEIVALKRLKMEKEKEGFPITSLREINMLLKARQHENVVRVREIVVGSNMDKIYLVMDYVEHDLKSLMETVTHNDQHFLISEIKTIMQQFLQGVAYLHDNWILHRDLKTSNLLFSHTGVLKIGDFGLAREYGSPLKPYTPVVVTLWYRAPELLLGVAQYSTHIDMWSVGCIMAELLTMKPFFTGRSEVEQLNRIFKVLGTPNDKIWEGYSELPGLKKFTFADYPYNSLRKEFGASLTEAGFTLLNRFLTYDPKKRITAVQALDKKENNSWFDEEPRPVARELFPTWPAKSERTTAAAAASRGSAAAGLKKPPSPTAAGSSAAGPAAAGVKGQQDRGGARPATTVTDKDLLRDLRISGSSKPSTGFSLKFDHHLR